MKRRMMISLVLAIVVVFGIYGLAFSGSGREPCPGCCVEGNLLPPTSGPFLYGTFTVSRDLMDVYGDFDHYVFHVELLKRLKTHLFTDALLGVGDGDLCSYTNSYLKEAVKLEPCRSDVGTAFGYDFGSYMPVIYSLSVFKKDFCYIDNDPNNGPNPYAMIKGLITIRLVPRPPQ